MKKKKDVLFLCQYFYPEYVSSATLPFDTAVALSKAGFKVGAMAGYPKEYTSTGEIPIHDNVKGIEIQRLKYIHLARKSKIGRLVNYFSFTFSVLVHLKEIRRYKAVIVYSNPPILPLVAVLAKKFFLTKFVFVSYDVYPEMAYIIGATKKNSLIGRAMEYINKKVTDNVDRIVALSTEMKHFLLQNRDIEESKIQVIPNWYENNESKKISFSKEILCLKSNGEFVVSYFGNLGICQDLNTILYAIRALKEEKKIKFVFAGHGNKMSLLKEIVEEEQLTNVSIFDFLQGDDYQAALKISNSFIVSLEEGLTGLAVPSKTYAYMMAGKPVLAIIGKNSDIANDLSKNNAGYALNPGEGEELVNGIRALSNSPKLEKEMGENCRRIYLEKYTTEIGTAQYVKLMGDILEG